MGQSSGIPSVNSHIGEIRSGTRACTRHLHLALDEDDSKASLKLQQTWTLRHTSLGYPGLPRMASEAKVTTDTYWLKPIPMPQQLLRYPGGEITSKHLYVDEGRQARGGVERLWELTPWTKVVSNYVLQVLLLDGQCEQGYKEQGFTMMAI